MFAWRWFVVAGGFKEAGREAEIRAQLSQCGPAAQLMGQLFDAVDDDRSGYLEKAEGKRFLGAAGCARSELDYYWKDLLRAADANGDGTQTQQSAPCPPPYPTLSLPYPTQVPATGIL